VDTTPLGRVLGEVIVREEVAELEELGDLPLALPHAVMVANAISDGTPKIFLINFNISPSLKDGVTVCRKLSGRKETQFC
jgi:hypothetical protein